MHEYELPTEARALLRELREAKGEIEEARRKLENEISLTRSALTAQEQRASQDRTFAQALVNNRIMAIELLADAWADYERATAAAEVDALRRKTRPAPRAADAIRAKGRELALVRRRAKLAEWTLALYEWHFPWLIELRDPGAEEGYLEALELEPDEDESAVGDPARHWLTGEEFAALSRIERNQLALDRYLRSRKSPWELGRDYERYVGYLREQAGGRVHYQGIFEGLDDLGRDLIVERDGELEVVQCKRWARSKTIHEKHVFQLFGTVVAMRIENPGRRVHGTFTTTTKLSDRARAFARQLEIAVEEELSLADYPRIKCNIARDTGERIYHLPFDQQYDTTVVEPDRGERYAGTVAEAEAEGFRRAWRWRRAGED